MATSLGEKATEDKSNQGSPVTLKLTIWVQTSSNIDTGLIKQHACLCEYVYAEGIE